MQKLIICLAFVSLFSCGGDPSEIGSDFFNGGAIDISYIDTVTVRLSTIMFDSLVTSGKERILAGTYTEGNLGTVTASPVMQFNNPTIVDLEAMQASYAYLALVLKYDTYTYYDTTATLTLQVKRLTENLETRTTGYLYNASRFAAETEPLGSVTFVPRPHRDDSVEIVLADELGLDLFNKINESSESVTNASKFIKYFKGLAVVPDAGTSSCFLGFSATPELRLYYNDRSKIPAEEAYIAFSVTSGLVYSHIAADRSATSLDALKTSKQKLAATETAYESYIQGGTGLAFRVDLPYLKDLAQPENFFITQAVLELYPVEKSYSKTAPLPETLTAYKLDKYNAQYGGFDTGVLFVKDEYLERDTHYELDVTDFVKEQIALEEFNENGIVFLTPTDTYATNIDRLYMASPRKNYRTRLKIYYATINNP